MRILKFGGTSVGSVEALQNMIQAVKKEYSTDTKLVIVCSAMSGVTNILQKMADDAAVGNSFSTDLKELEQKHTQVVSKLLHSQFQNEVLIFQKILFNEIENILESIATIQEVSPKTNAKILSYGEKLSSFLISFLVKQEICQAVYTNAEELIVTDSQFDNAKVDFEKTTQNIENWYQTTLDNQAIPIVTGFIAANEQGITTTLGRGGSDYTASILGSVLKADEIQIWTDVDGFMTADPRWVTNAMSLPELSYAEAMELSYFGAKVIYPPTMIPAVDKQIPILIKNTFNPDYKGTVIHKKVSHSPSLAKGIASISEVCLVNIEGNGLVGFKGFSGRLFSALAQVEVNVIMITQASSEHSISFAIEPKDVKKAQKAISEEFEYEILSKKIEKIHLEKEVSIIAVVGENMRHSEGLAGKVFYALGRVGVNIMAIAQGSSELNISMVIKKNSLGKAINAIHNDLFLSKTKNAHLVVAGVGNIGKTLLNQLKIQSQNLSDSQNLQLKLIGISNSKKNLINPKDLNFENWQTQLEQMGSKLTLDQFFEHIKNTNLPNVVFVDNTANQEISAYYKTLLDNNISVVTCNKIATSDSQKDYDLLKEIALKRNVNFLYETNVGAGLPIIKTLQDLIDSGDKIVKIEAILSGTISYIFNNYVGDKTFAQVVKEAQEKGFTEPNPVDDLSGKDFARKMLIIARESGLKLEMDDIKLYPILPESCLKSTDVNSFYQCLTENETFFASQKEKAKKNQEVLRYIGSFYEGKVEIKVQSVGISHPFYGLTGSDNIISITTERYFHNPLVVKGPGAGAEVTAAGVFADIMRAAKTL